MKNSPGKCKKSGCSLCKSENPLYENIPSEKNLLLPRYSNFCAKYFDHNVHSRLLNKTKKNWQISDSKIKDDLLWKVHRKNIFKIPRGVFEKSQFFEFCPK